MQSIGSDSVYVCFTSRVGYLHQICLLFGTAIRSTSLHCTYPAVQLFNKISFLRSLPLRILLKSIFSSQFFFFTTLSPKPSFFSRLDNWAKFNYDSFGKSILWFKEIVFVSGIKRSSNSGKYLSYITNSCNNHRYHQL